MRRDRKAVAVPITLPSSSAPALEQRRLVAGEHLLLSNLTSS